MRSRHERTQSGRGMVESTSSRGMLFGVEASFVDTGGHRIPHKSGLWFVELAMRCAKRIHKLWTIDVERMLIKDCVAEAIISDTGPTRRGLELRICNIVWEEGGAAHMVWRGTETT